MEMESWKAVVLIVGILVLLVYMVLLERRLYEMDKYTDALLDRIDELEGVETFEEFDERRTDYALERQNEKEDKNSQEKSAQEKANEK